MGGFAARKALTIVEHTEAGELVVSNPNNESPGLSAGYGVDGRLPGNGVFEAAEEHRDPSESI